MSEYILILLWIGLCAFFAKCVKVTKSELVCGVEEERYYWFFAFIVFLPIILMAGFRDKWFADTGIYVIEYSKIPDEFSSVSSYLDQVSKDKGFAFLSFLIKNFVGNDYRIYLIVIAFIQGVIVLSFFRKYSTNYLISVFLFIASTDYISWMFNGIRQFTAVAIILCATPFILKRKWIPTILLILLASTMHLSALLMIPLVIIAQGEAWNKKTLLFILSVLVVVLFIGSFTSFLDNALVDTQYKSVVTDYKEWNDNGTHPLRVAVYSIPAVISFFGRRRIVKDNSPILNLSVNMSIFASGLYVVSLFTSGIFLGRLPIYCSLFSYLLLPWEIENVFDNDNSRWVRIIMIALYIGFYLYQIIAIWNLWVL